MKLSANYQMATGTAECQAPGCTAQTGRLYSAGRVKFRACCFGHGEQAKTAQEALTARPFPGRSGR